MSFITKPLGNIVGSITGQTQADAAQSAGQQQQAGAASANQILENQFNQTRTDLQPYASWGANTVPQVADALTDPALHSNFSYADFTAPTAAEAAATPGYQFTLDQGLKANQNSASARGLGSSGAALKGASTFATGLADSTYGDTYNRALQGYTTNRNNALSNFTTNYGVANDNVNRLLGIVNVGENAAARTGALGAQTASSIANNTTSAAAAGAAGTVGAANAYGKATNNLINLATLYGS